MNQVLIANHLHQRLNPHQRGVVFFALGALTDAYVIANDGGGAQVVVTTSLMDGRRYIMRRTSAYYIAGADFAHYATNAPTADLLVPPERSGEPPPVRSLSVVEE